MTAAIDIITDAATAAGAFDPEESLSAGKAQYILRRLNRMIGSWANERLMLYLTYVDYIPLIAGQREYLSSVFTHGRPTQWIDATLRTPGPSDLPLEMIEQDVYKSISDLWTQGQPRYVYIYNDYPVAQALFYPVPSDSTMIAVFGLRRPLTDTLTLTSDIDLPPGYEAAIVDNLAVDISPSFGLQPSQQLLDTARNEKMVLKRNNRIALTMDTGLPGRGGRFNILSG